MAVWEYKTVKRKEDELLTEEQLNVLGTHGFDIVAMLPIQQTEVIVGKHVTRTEVHYIFKRPKPAAATPAATPRPASPASPAPSMPRPATPAPAKPAGG